MSYQIEKVDKETTGGLTLGGGGNLAFQNANQLMEFAKIMAVGGVAIPEHLRKNPGACMAICIQASEWQMSPFAVANKSYSVKDRLAYESQLVNAVILRRAPITGRFQISYSGAGEARQCTVAVNLKDGGTAEYTSPPIATIPVKNSPLWKGDPDQQLFYYSSRALCRRHFPDVLLGVYTQDELTDERQVTGSATTVDRFVQIEEFEPPVPDGDQGDPETEVIASHETKAPEVPPILTCDGNHGGGACKDPECWHKQPAAPEPEPEPEPDFSLEPDPHYPAEGTDQEKFDHLANGAGLSDQEVLEGLCFLKAADQRATKLTPKLLSVAIANWDDVKAAAQQCQQEGATA